MNKDQSLNVMSYIDPALIQQADVSRARRSGKPFKIALIAACICVLTVGSVFAAVEVLTGAGILNFTPDSDADFTVEYMSKNFPLSAFSEQILEDENSIAAFESWDEAEAYIGFDIMDNALLSAAEKIPAALIMPDDITQPHCYVDKGVDENFGLLELLVGASFNVNGVQADVYAFLYTEAFAELYPENADSALMKVHNLNEAEMLSEEYTAKNGLVSSIVSTATPGFHTVYTAYFSIGGVMFILDAQCADSDTAALQTLKNILDAFVLE